MNDSAPDPSSPASATPPPASDLVEDFLAADGRARKKLLSSVLEHADAERLRRLAPALRDPSPRVGSRLTSALARAGMDEVFLQAIQGIKPARAAQLCQQFARIAGRPPRGSSPDVQGDSSR